MKKLVKVTGRMPEEDLAKLRALAEVLGLNEMDAMRSAVRTHLFVLRQVALGGRLVLIKADGEAREIVLSP